MEVITTVAVVAVVIGAVKALAYIATWMGGDDD
jgi:hypothetical protein